MDLLIRLFTSLPVDLASIVSQYYQRPDTVFLLSEHFVDNESHAQSTIRGAYRSFEDAVFNAKTKSPKCNLLEVMVGQDISDGLVWVYTWHRGRYIRYKTVIYNVRELPDLEHIDLTGVSIIKATPYGGYDDPCTIEIDTKWSHEADG